MKRVYDPEQLRLKEMRKLYAFQSKKQFNYTEDDFEIEKLHANSSVYWKWKHKSWKTWCMPNDAGITATQNLIKKYIAECKKPYGTRNFEFVHLIKD